MIACLLIPGFELRAALRARPRLALVPAALAPDAGEEPLLGPVTAAAEAAGVKPGMRVEQEEIFGPALAVLKAKDLSEAIRINNDVKYGLFATVWTGDPARGHRIASRIKAGTVGINMPYTAFPGIPFGGYKQSGFGRELGLETLDLYLETKSVLVSTGSRPINPFGL